jgi:Uncharacterised protein family (UPF0158)
MPQQDTPKRKLSVNLSELESVFDTSFEFTSHYLDLETGRIIMITEDVHRWLEKIYEQMQSQEGGEPIDFATALEQCNVPDGEKDLLRVADQIEAGYGTRYAPVPEADTHQDFRDMEDFIVTVRNERLQDRLWRAISGRGAFRYFKDVLADHPRERECWFKFKDARVRQRVLDWLDAQGIEPGD